MRIGYLWESQRGKRPLGRSKCRCVDNIRMDLVEIGWGGVDWIRQVQDRNKFLYMR
jgi:hypothetical protein